MKSTDHVDSRRVMLVDDDADTRRLLRIIFELDGHHVVAEFACEEEAVPEGARSAPDVVVIDTMLSGESSVPLLRRMRALTPGVRLIAYSAMPAATSADAALAAGADVYLEKGELEALRSAVSAPAPLTDR